MRQGWLVVLVLAMVWIAFPSAVSAQTWTGDRFVFGEDFVLRSGETLDGSLTVMGGSAVLEAGSVVTGDVAMLGGRLTVAGTVQGNVVAFGAATSLTESAAIRGDLAAFGGAVQRAPGARVAGEVFGRLQPLGGLPTLPSRGSTTAVWEQILRWELATLGTGLLLVLLGVVAMLVAPRHLDRIAGAISQQAALSFAMGLLTFVLAVLAGALLLIACGLGLLVWLLLSAAWLVGWLAMGLWAGRRLLGMLRAGTISACAEMALGVFLITLVGRLPWCIGTLFSAVVGFLGLGAVVLTRFGTLPAGGSQPGSAPQRTEASGSDRTAAAAEPAAVDQAPEAGAPNGTQE